jgi:hypothetical protein
MSQRVKYATYVIAENCWLIAVREVIFLAFPLSIYIHDFFSFMLFTSFFLLFIKIKKQNKLRKNKKLMAETID